MESNQLLMRVLILYAILWALSAISSQVIKIQSALPVLIWYMILRTLPIISTLVIKFNHAELLNGAGRQRKQLAGTYACMCHI